MSYLFVKTSTNRRHGTFAPLQVVAGVWSVNIAAKCTNPIHHVNCIKEIASLATQVRNDD